MVMDRPHQQVQQEKSYDNIIVKYTQLKASFELPKDALMKISP